MHWSRRPDVTHPLLGPHGAVRAAVGLDAELDRAELVVTGEGSFDTQSLRGKLAAAVAAGAAERGVPCLVLAGQVQLDPGEAAAAGVHAAFAVRARRLGGRRAGRPGGYPRRARRARRRAPGCVTMRGGNHRSRDDVGPDRELRAGTIQGEP